jgi:hypothetical protein
MTDDIKTSEDRTVGRWDGNSVEELKQELKRIGQVLAAEGKGEKLQPRNVPHRDQLPRDLLNFSAYALWGCDKSGSCLVGAAATRIEPVEKVLAFSLVDHH